jgi:hypothetical protein
MIGFANQSLWIRMLYDLDVKSLEVPNYDGFTNVDPQARSTDNVFDTCSVHALGLVTSRAYTMG